MSVWITSCFISDTSVCKTFIIIFVVSLAHSTLGEWVILNSKCKDRFWILSPQGNRIKAQRAQYKEFLKSGLKTRFWWVGQRP